MTVVAQQNIHAGEAMCPTLYKMLHSPGRLCQAHTDMLDTKTPAHSTGAAVTWVSLWATVHTFTDAHRAEIGTDAVFEEIFSSTSPPPWVKDASAYSQARRAWTLIASCDRGVMKNVLSKNAEDGNIC